jgi:hypothetical protein
VNTAPGNIARVFKKYDAKPVKPKESRVQAIAEENRLAETESLLSKLRALDTSSHFAASNIEFLKFSKRLISRFESKSVQYQFAISGNAEADDQIPARLEEWYQVFVKYAIIATREGNQEEAQMALETVVSSKHYIGNPKKMTEVRLLMLGMFN